MCTHALDGRAIGSQASRHDGNPALLGSLEFRLRKTLIQLAGRLYSLWCWPPSTSASRFTRLRIPGIVLIALIFYSAFDRFKGGIMGRTMLYVLIGIAVVGALAVLLLITPMVGETEVAPEIPAVTDIEPELPEETEPVVSSEVATTETDEDTTEPIIEEPMIASETGYSIDGTIVSGEYAHETTIAGVDVYWTNDEYRLRVGLVSPGTGFVAIGFDPERQMEGANFIIGSMHEGVLTIRDDYGYEALAHMEDTARGGEDNIIAAAGNEWPDQTVIEFIIPLDSGDTMDKPLLPGHQYTILVSYHSMLDSFSNRHTRRGSGLMQLDLPE